METAYFTAAENEASGTYLFRTNDTDYLSPGGKMFWKITETTFYPEVTATVTKQSGTRQTGYGIVFFRRTSGGKEYFLTVLINTMRQYMIGKYSAGVYVPIQDWTYSPLLKAGYGVQNLIHVSYDAQIKLFTLNFNGAEETVFADTTAPRLTTGASGLVVAVSPFEQFADSVLEVVFHIPVRE